MPIKPHHIILAVTNDLQFDQRMQRICTSLANNGYAVSLIGRTHKNSKPLQENVYIQRRFKCWFQKGKLFYVEYNIKLLLYLLFYKKGDVYCAIDLDTIIPIYYISKFKNAKRVYDAHELFCEMQEIVSRPIIYKFWKGVEKLFVPKFPKGYTIGTMYAKEFNNLYGHNYTIVRNATILKPMVKASEKKEKYILYQGAVNEGRCFETLIPAMVQVNAALIICGHGNAFNMVQNLIVEHGLEQKVFLKGYIEPQELINYTKDAYIGITLFSHQGKSNYLSLANRFFDYMHSNIPQIAMNYPEYALINKQFEIACLIDDTHAESISTAINKLLNNEWYHEHLTTQATLCKQQYCWQEEEKTLLNFYKQLL